MDDKTLLNIALIVTFTGLVALLMLSYYDLIPEKNFNEVTSKDVDSIVKVSGTITAVYPHNNSMTLRLEQKCVMDIFFFGNNPDLNAGKKVTVEGTVQEYNGKMEIMANKIVEMQTK
ncbi:MAG: hypothetical protein ACP5OA_07820 [Candidatus Woesearchaeota archaeon]